MTVSVFHTFCHVGPWKRPTFRPGWLSTPCVFREGSRDRPASYKSRRPLIRQTIVCRLEGFDASWLFLGSKQPQDDELTGGRARKDDGGSRHSKKEDALLQGEVVRFRDWSGCTDQNVWDLVWEYLSLAVFTRRLCSLLQLIPAKVCCPYFNTSSVVSAVLTLYYNKDVALWSVS